MSGSRKGERRGNAKRRTKAQPIPTHETPHDVMKEATKQPFRMYQGDHGKAVGTFERRVQISRIIHGDSGSVLDMTPKEVMLAAMHHNMQAVQDWKEMLMVLAAQPPNEDNTRLVAEAEREIERLLDKAGDHAFKLAPFIHPRLSAIALNPTKGDNPASILEQLLDEIDERERSAPPLIEYDPKKGAT